ncbi:NADH-dependent flavin oxidoreductase [Paenibacillus harenae]|uniref:NADH-dependent flavin oxidoreductase n=1 Tax=Paenibacillus harenae TaxID=306543 RepID=UPI0003FCFDE9|nr:NADH-dependent flavin oxidoreductase [Paenibacillus harenae]
MHTSDQPIFAPFEFQRGLRLKNRIIMAPMTHMSSNPDGSISEQELTYYMRRASGVSMVITAATWVSEAGGLPGAAGADRDAFIPGLRRLASSIQAQGAAAVLQIFHAGRQSSRTGDYVSAGPIPEDKEGAAIPRELTEAEIPAIIRAFGEAAGRAVDAGFDGVEIHGGNGNLLHQFFSPYTNRRNDRYGGTLRKRMALALAIIEEVQRTVRSRAVKPFIVGYRLSPEEPGTPGITMSDTLAFADALTDSGLDYIHISLNDFRSVPRRGADSSRSRLSIMQERYGHRIPIIGVGGVHTPSDATLAMQTGIPLLAVGRQLVMEPDWMKLAAEGREGKIKTTLTSNDQQLLDIPDSMWSLISSIPGWFPFERHSEK